MPHRIICWVLLFLTQICYGQIDNNPLHFAHLSINEGLSHNTVFSILQDQYGYIWIGTQNGLNKYDGYSFKVYQSNSAKNYEDGFQGKYISALFEDRNGNLWVGTKKQGVNIKLKSNVNFINLKSDSVFSAIEGVEISSFFEDKAGNIWITTTGAGILKYQPKANKSKNFNTKNSNISSDVVFDLVEDKYGVIWAAAAGGGLNYLDNDSTFKQSHQMLPNNPNMSGFKKKLLLDDDYLWIGTQGTGLYKMNLKDRSYIHFARDSEKRTISSNAVMDIFKTEDGKIFIATDGNGLNVYDIATDKISILKSQPYDKTALNSNSLLCLFGDKTDNIWVGTFNGGINIYKPNKTWFDFYAPQAIASELQKTSVLSILPYRNEQILLGTDGGGLSIIQEKESNDKVLSFVHDSDNPNSIAGNVVKTLFEDSQGQIWVGLFAGGLDLFKPSTQSFEHFLNWQSNVWAITEIKNKGKLLIGTLGNGLYTIDIQSKEINRFQPSSTKLNSSTDLNIMTVFADQSGKIWIGAFDNGLDMIDEENKVYKYFKNDPLDSSSISNDEIRVLFQDSDGDIWIGTEGGGLNQWLGDDRFRRIGIIDGLISNNIMGITEDENGFLWISTFEGISRLDRKNYEIKNFNFRTTENTNQFNQNSILKNKDGSIYFGGINGMHSIQPEKVKEISWTPELRFTDLKIFGKSIAFGELSDGRTILKEPIESSSDIWLSYLDQSFTIFFNAMDYTNPSENKFAFKLEGFNEDWEYTSTNKPQATYTNLNAGTYIFKIKHKEKVHSIKIHIKPPYWKTIWFRLLVFALTVGGIVAILYFWIKRREAAANRKILQLQNEKLATEVEAKNSKLMFSSIQIAHKNEIITELKESLIAFKKNPESNLRPLVRKLDDELKNENYWKEFNLYFNEVDRKFLDRIIKKHPKLTQNDQRMCSLIRMNLSTKEMSSLLNTSVRAVEQSRYRLKKRLGLSKSDDLLRYISSFQE